MQVCGASAQGNSSAWEGGCSSSRDSLARLTPLHSRPMIENLRHPSPKALDPKQLFACTRTRLVRALAISSLTITCRSHATLLSHPDKHRIRKYGASCTDNRRKSKETMKSEEFGRSRGWLSCVGGRDSRLEIPRQLCNILSYTFYALHYLQKGRGTTAC